MAESSLGPLIAAIEALYGTDNAARSQADDWLNSYQKGADAWTSSSLLLQNATASQATRTFAAQTIRKKVTSDLYQLDDAARWNLKESLFSILQSSSQQLLPRIVRNQICATLAILALQLPSWTSERVVDDAVELLSRDTNNLPVLIQYLAALPEEMTNSAHVPITDEEYQHRHSDVLGGNAPRVLSLLNDFLEKYRDALESQVFSCLTEWVRVGMIPVLALGNGQILPRLFEGLQKDDEFDAAVDAVCAIVHETQEIDGFEELIHILLQQLTSLRLPLNQAIADEETEKLRDFCRLYSEVSETYVQLIVANPDQWSSIIEAMADLAALSDLDIVPITFNFWYRLARMLALPKNGSKKEQFAPLFTQLLDVIIRHLRYPDDESRWTPQERDEFREFRHEMGDTLKDCCAVLGFPYCLRSALARISQAFNQPADSLRWQDIEAPLFSLRAMGAEVDVNDNEIMPEILSILPKLPQHPKLQYASTLVISRYSQWTANHPDTLGDQLTYVSSGFEEAEVKGAAALAFKHLCNDCSQTLIGLLPQLEQFYAKLATGLSGEELEDASDAIGAVIESCPGPEKLAALRRVCLPLIQDLADTQSSRDDPENKRIRAIDRLDALAYLLRATSPPEEGLNQDCIDLVAQIWPLIDHILANNPSDVTMLERVGTVIRRGLNFYGEKAVVAAPGFANRIAEGFEGTGDASYLWMGEKFLRVFAGLSPELGEIAKACVERCCAKVLQRSSTGTAKELALMIDDFVHFCLAALEVIPNTIIPSPVLPAAIQVAYAGLDLTAVDTIQICLDFIRDLLSRLVDTTAGAQAPQTNGDLTAAKSSSGMKVVIHNVYGQFGPFITATLLRNLALNFPEDASYNVATIFRLMALGLSTETFWNCLNHAAKELPIEGRPLLASERDRFLTNVQSAMNNGVPNKVREATNVFRARTSMLRPRMR